MNHKLTTAYESSVPTRSIRRRLAETFCPNAEMDALLALRQSDPEAFSSLSGKHVALGHYEAAREAALAEGLHANADTAT